MKAIKVNITDENGTLFEQITITQEECDEERLGDKDPNTNQAKDAAARTLVRGVVEGALEHELRRYLMDEEVWSTKSGNANEEDH